MVINVFLKNRLVLNWFNSVSIDLAKMYTFKIHSTMQSYKNELDIKANKTLAIIDVEDPSFELFTSSYFKENKDIRFIGIGNKKNIDELINIIKANVKGFVSCNCNSIDLMKAIESVKNGQLHITEELKEIIVNKYFFQSNKKFKYNNIQNNDLISDSNVLSEEIKSLTQKEQRVCDLLIQGLSYKEIAQVIGVTTYTINQKSKNLFKKLKVKSRAELSYKVLN